MCVNQALFCASCRTPWLMVRSAFFLPSIFSLHKYHFGIMQTPKTRHIQIFRYAFKMFSLQIESNHFHFIMCMRMAIQMHRLNEHRPRIIVDYKTKYSIDLKNFKGISLEIGRPFTKS